MSNHEQTTEIDGITEGYTAAVTPCGATASVALILDCNGELAFTLPANCTAEAINHAISAFEQGMRHGERYGFSKAQRSIREALGIDLP